MDKTLVNFYIKIKIFTVGIARYMTDKYYSMYMDVMTTKQTYTNTIKHCNSFAATVAYPLVSFSILRSFRRVLFTQIYCEWVKFLQYWDRNKNFQPWETRLKRLMNIISLDESNMKPDKISN